MPAATTTLSASPRPLRALFLGEGVLGHRTLELQLRRLVGAREDLEGRFETVPPPNRLERLLLRGVPPLGTLDLHPLRWRIRWSLRARGLATAATDADVVLANSQACALLAGAAMRARPWVLSVDCTARQWAELEFWRAQDRFASLGEGLLDRLERRAYAGAHTVIAWTEWAASSVRDDYGVPAERVATIHPGVELDAFQAPRAEGGRGDLRLVFVGNNAMRKGLGEIVESLGLLQVPARLDVVTSDAVGPWPGVAVHRGVGPRSPELARLLAGADVLVHTPRADASPLVVLEGMAAGLVVVASEVGAIPELVGDAGVTIPPGDPVRLAREINALGKAPERRRELSERARARAAERYDARVQGAHLLDLLADAAGHPLRPSSGGPRV